MRPCHCSLCACLPLSPYPALRLLCLGVPKDAARGSQAHSSHGTRSSPGQHSL